jgi:type I site-specific restriction endonuclease
MNPIFFTIYIGLGLFFLQAIGFSACLKLTRREKNKRDKEFALIDKERLELTKLENILKEDLAQARLMSDTILQKLKDLSNQAEMEWQNIALKVHELVELVDHKSKDILEANIMQASKVNLQLAKTCKTAEHLQEALEESRKNTHKTLRLLDQNVQADDLLKQIQTEKYTEAKELLLKGIEPHVISKKLGISMGELILLSSYS